MKIMIKSLIMVLMVAGLAACGKEDSIGSQAGGLPCSHVTNGNWYKLGQPGNTMSLTSSCTGFNEELCGASFTYSISGNSLIVTFTSIRDAGGGCPSNGSTHSCTLSTATATNIGVSCPTLFGNENFIR